MYRYSHTDIERFLEAQDFPFSGYDVALEEIRAGEKMSHWIWYIFPQLRTLGKSNHAIYYGIADSDEAWRYLANPTLNLRIREITQALLEHKEKSAVEILGHIDALKVRSSMTMFDCISPDDIFQEVLDAFYDGTRCQLTLAAMAEDMG